MASSWDQFVVTLASSRGHFGVILASSRDLVGVMLAHFSLLAAFFFRSWTLLCISWPLLVHLGSFLRLLERSKLDFWRHFWTLCCNFCRKPCWHSPSAFRLHLQRGGTCEAHGIDAENDLFYNIDFSWFWCRFGILLGLQDGTKLAPKVDVW